MGYNLINKGQKALMISREDTQSKGIEKRIVKICPKTTARVEFVKIIGLQKSAKGESSKTVVFHQQKTLKLQSKAVTELKIVPSKEGIIESWQMTRRNEWIRKQLDFVVFCSFNNSNEKKLRNKWEVAESKMKTGNWKASKNLWEKTDSKNKGSAGRRKSSS